MAEASGAKVSTVPEGPQPSNAQVPEDTRNPEGRAA